MNPYDRLFLWNQHLAAAQASLDSVRDRFPNIGEAAISTIRNGWKAQVKTAADFVSYYEDKVSQQSS